MNRLIVDCTTTIRTGLKTGVQRVVRSLIERADIISSSLSSPVVPVVFHKNKIWRLSSPADSMIPSDELIESWELIRVEKKDEVLLLDSWWASESTEYFLSLPNVRIHTILYDLIPIQHPQFFKAETIKSFEAALNRILNSSALVICISSQVKHDLAKYITENHSKLRHPKIADFKLGSFKSSEKKDLESVSREPLNFLMVGTLEERKGYRFILGEFDKLWKTGSSAKITIVGKLGEHGEEISEKCSSLSQQFGKLTHLTNISDKDLERLYSTKSALIFASTAEGFGLPLAEGIHFGIPIIASDTPITREVAGEYPHYFKANHTESFQAALRKHNEKTSKPPPTISWDESATILAKKILGEIND